MLFVLAHAVDEIFRLDYRFIALVISWLDYLLIGNIENVPFLE